MNLAKPLRQKAQALCLFLALLVHLIPSSQASPNLPNISGDAAILIEATTGRVLYEKNADQMRIPASMTKMMTAYIVFEEIYHGNLSLDTPIPITEHHAYLSASYKNLPGGIAVLPANTTITVDALLKLMLLPSSSAACVVIADYISGSEALFVQRMNQTAKGLSMDANYENCHGGYAHYVTPRSQARLAQVLLEEFPQILAYTALPSATWNGKTFTNLNQLLPGNSYGYQGTDGFKTGSISSSGSNLTTTCQQNGVRLIAVVMKSSTANTCSADTVALLDYGFTQMRADPSTFQDTSDNAQVESLYQQYHQKGVLLQGQNGLARPYDPITKGEFSATLISALEQASHLPNPSTKPPSTPWVADLQQYYGGKHISRGIAYGILSTDSSGLFSPQQNLSQKELTALLHQTSLILGGSPYYYGTLGFTQNTIAYGTYAALAVPFTSASLAAALALPFPSSTGSLGSLGSATSLGDTVSRAEALLAIHRLLESV